MSKAIKNIILDLGGVIINLNPNLTINGFKDLFKEKYETIFNQIEESKFLDRFEVGEFSSNEFCGFFQEFDSKITNTLIHQAWNNMLLDIPKERIDTIRRLSSKYNIYLLSNTNKIHYSFIDDYARNSLGLNGLAELFNKLYLSHEINLRKPNKAIFEYVLSDGNLKPEETLFLDDSMEHIESAKSLGINAHHLDLEAGQNLKDFFNEY